MKFRALQEKRRFISGKRVIGIDPAKKKHQAAILDEQGLQAGKPFTFGHTYDGFHTTLWNKINLQLSECNPQDVVFSVETSCNLWQKLVQYLHAKGYSVVLVNPVTTKRTRPFFNHDFSHTDPKDAMLMASNARDGYFDHYIHHEPLANAMHQLSITYCKLVRNYVQQRTRLRSVVELIFPEFCDILPLSTKSAMYLLSKYLFPQDFLQLDLEGESKELERISQKQHGKLTLQALKQAATRTIGIPAQPAEMPAYRVTLDAWLDILKSVEKNMNQLLDQLFPLAEQTPYFEILTSLKGISAKLAALFIAETRELSCYRHYKQLEKLIGYNLRQRTSGEYIGTGRISHIGNRRLSWIVYKMTEGAVKYVPEVRMKFLRRQLRKKSYRKNLIASAPTLLKLIVALVKENRTYEYKSDSLHQLNELEEQYREVMQKKSKSPRFKQAA